MPRGDGTGPMGMGPMTGRGAGYCAGFSTPGYVNSTPRMGMAFGRGSYFYGRGAGFGLRGGRGPGFGNFGRGRGFRGRGPGFAPALSRGPVYPNYGYGAPNQYPTYPTYPARPVYGIW